MLLAINTKFFRHTIETLEIYLIEEIAIAVIEAEASFNATNISKDEV